MGEKKPDKFTLLAYPDCEPNQGITRAAAALLPGLWVPLKWQSNRPTVKSSIKKMGEQPLKKQHRPKEASQNKEKWWKHIVGERHQGGSDGEDAEGEHRSREQGQQLKQRLKDVGRANTSREKVCKKPLPAKEPQVITATAFLLPIPCAFLDGPLSQRTSCAV